MKVLPRKEFREKHGKFTGWYDKDTREVEVPQGASTRTRLHELGHKKLHQEGREIDTIEELVGHELDAELYAYEMSDKEASIEVAKVAIDNAVAAGVTNANGLFNVVMNALKERGFDTSDREIRSDVWRYIRREIEEEKRSRF